MNNISSCSEYYGFDIFEAILFTASDGLGLVLGPIL